MPFLFYSVNFSPTFNTHLQCHPPSNNLTTIPAVVFRPCHTYFYFSLYPALLVILILLWDLFLDYSSLRTTAISSKSPESCITPNIKQIVGMLILHCLALSLFVGINEHSQIYSEALDQLLISRGNSTHSHVQKAHLTIWMLHNWHRL